MNFKYYHFPKDVILTCVRWYLRYKLSYHDLEEMMAKRGIQVDHATINRWVLKFSPLLMAEARKHKQAVGSSWRLDKTYIKVRGQWKYLYRAVDKEGNTIDFLLTAKRDIKAASRFLKRSIKNSGVPEKINIDKSGSNKAAIQRYNEDFNTTIEIRQCKYLNNIIEQDHRFVKQKMRAALGFKSFRSAQATISGIELVRMIHKGQLCLMNEASNIDRFNRLAA
jgi:transposase-like protein